MSLAPRRVLTPVGGNADTESELPPKAAASPSPLRGGAAAAARKLRKKGGVYKCFATHLMRDWLRLSLD